MPYYDYRCECGRVEEIECHMGDAPSKIHCPCGKWAARVYVMPLVNLNKWNTGYRFNDVSEELDCDKEAIAIGMDE